MSRMMLGVISALEANLYIPELVHNEPEIERPARLRTRPFHKVAFFSNQDNHQITKAVEQKTKLGLQRSKQGPKITLASAERMISVLWLVFMIFNGSSFNLFRS